MKNRGVTLIALVITIIVLLILASVSITTLFGQDGIITKAQDAARKTKEASENEQAFLNYATDYMDSLTRDSVAERVDGVPIPKGFKVSTVAGENTKAGGLVIIDEGVTKNEFVWVPVEDLIAEDGTVDGTFTDDQKFGRRLFGTSYSLGVENMPEELTKSVAKYGGFYIARYEASYKDGKPASVKSADGSAIPWANTNGRLWNWISQTEAITVCEDMYGVEASVVSHLPYGAEWDSTLQWFKETEFSNSNTSIASDSSSWGNFLSSTFKYGTSLITKHPGDHEVILSSGVITDPPNKHRVKNIYDMAGNLYEWTQENLLRGGSINVNYDGMYGGYTAASRTFMPISDGQNFGFRIAIYIK